MALDIISQLHVIMNEEDMVNREAANKQKKRKKNNKAQESKTPKEEKEKEKEKEKENEKEKEKEKEKEPENGEGKAKGKQKKKERKKEAEKERREIQRGPPGFCLTPVVPPIIFTHRFRLTDLSPLELARQMTVFVATGLKGIIAEVSCSPPTPIKIHKCFYLNFVLVAEVPQGLVMDPRLKEVQVSRVAEAYQAFPKGLFLG